MHKINRVFHEVLLLDRPRLHGKWKRESSSSQSYSSTMHNP